MTTRPFAQSIIIAVLMVNVGCSTEPGTDADVLAAQEKVRELLRDPESARFKNISRHGDVVCGEVNSRNGFGGYAGFADFSYEISTGEARVDDMDEGFAVPLAKSTCDLARTKEELREIKARRAQSERT